MTNTNREIITDILNTMSEDKKAVLSKALDRNEVLTSSRVLWYCTMTIYKEGFYIEMEGTRCGFKVFARDNDGELEIIRKPADSKLHKLYEEADTMDEEFYRGF